MTLRTNSDTPPVSPGLLSDSVPAERARLLAALGLVCLDIRKADHDPAWLRKLAADLTTTSGALVTLLRREADALDPPGVINPPVQP